MSRRSEEKINSAYAQVTGQGAKHILLNFRQNDYINSAGIAILIGIVTEVNRNNQKLGPAYRSTSRRFSAWSAWRSMPISIRTRTRRSAVSPLPPADKMTR